MDEYLQKRLQQSLTTPTFVYLFAHKGEASFTEIFEGGKENYYGKEYLISFYYSFSLKNKNKYHFRWKWNYRKFTRKKLYGVVVKYLIHIVDLTLELL